MRANCFLRVILIGIPFLLGALQIVAAETLQYEGASIPVDSVADVGNGLAAISMGGESWIAAKQRVGRMAALRLARSGALFEQVSPEDIGQLVRRALVEQDGELLKEILVGLASYEKFSDSQVESILGVIEVDSFGLQILREAVQAPSFVEDVSPVKCRMLVLYGTVRLERHAPILSDCKRYALARAMERSLASDVEGAIHSVQFAALSDASFDWIVPLARAYDAGIAGNEDAFMGFWSVLGEQDEGLRYELKKLVLRRVIDEASRNKYYSVLRAALLMTGTQERSPLHHSAMLQLLRERPTLITSQLSDTHVQDVLRVYADKDAEIRVTLESLRERLLPEDALTVIIRFLLRSPVYVLVLLMLGVLGAPFVCFQGFAHVAGGHKGSSNLKMKSCKEREQRSQCGKLERLHKSYREALLFFNLSEEASLSEIKAAYRRRLKKVHPDSSGSLCAPTDSVTTVRQRYEELTHLRRTLELSESEV